MRPLSQRRHEVTGNLTMFGGQITTVRIGTRKRELAQVCALTTPDLENARPCPAFEVHELGNKRVHAVPMFERGATVLGGKESLVLDIPLGKLLVRELVVALNVALRLPHHRPEALSSSKPRGLLVL